MNLKIAQTPQVELLVSTYPTDLQDFYYNSIRPILADNPYPSPGFTVVEAFTSSELRPFYQYFDGVFPAVFQYRVYETSSGTEQGLVVVTRAIPIELL